MAKLDLPLRSPGVFTFALMALVVAVVSACGLGGSGGGASVPACRTDVPTEPPAPSPEASLTLQVGSYTGAGSPQCVSGIGFQPALVIIKAVTGEWAVWRSSSMEGDSTAYFIFPFPNFEGAIRSLDPDAFSLEADSTINNRITYYYVAFANSPDTKVGSYVGDGIDGRSITGVGFQPAIVLLKHDGDGAAVWSSISHPEGVSSFFGAEEDRTDLIRGFEADGFQLSSDPLVNAGDGSTYHYVAFPEAAGLVATGTYTGDGSDDRDITDVGFQPDYVWIKRSTAESAAVHRSSSLTGDETLRFTREPTGTDEITALQPDGFQVGSGLAVNFDGDTYHYIAWKSSSGP